MKSEHGDQYIKCNLCGASTLEGYTHHCNQWFAASMNKFVCMDCTFHHCSTVEELQTIPVGGYCKHFTPEWWVEQGYVRYWGDAAVNAFPILEILRKETETNTKYLIIQPQLRRTVEIFVDKKTGYSWGSF
jgi:hypothetical protein